MVPAWQSLGLMNSDALKMALERLDAEFFKTAPAREALQEKSPDSTRVRLERRVAREPELRAAVDQACLQWAAGAPWPLTDPETCVFLWDRVVEARIFGQWLVERGTQFVGKSDRDVLRWVLVDYWVLAGFYRWYARLWAAQRADG